MSNPVLINLPKETWTKVATNVLVGQIHKEDEIPRMYLCTYRMTGDSAPLDDERDDGINLFPNLEKSAQILNGQAIDVYIMPLMGNGQVRVDLCD